MHASLLTACFRMSSSKQAPGVCLGSAPPCPEPCHHSPHGWWTIKNSWTGRCLHDAPLALATRSLASSQDSQPSRQPSRPVDAQRLRARAADGAAGEPPAAAMAAAHVTAWAEHHVQVRVQAHDTCVGWPVRLRCRGRRRDAGRSSSTACRRLRVRVGAGAGRRVGYVRHRGCALALARTACGLCRAQAVLERGGGVQAPQHLCGLADHQGQAQHAQAPRGVLQRAAGSSVSCA